MSRPLTQRATKPKCHPGRPYHAHGLCKTCYGVKYAKAHPKRSHKTTKTSTVDRLGKDGISTSSVQEYRRGVLHGLTAARAIAYNYDGGRSWTAATIAGEISDLVADIPAAIVVIGDALKDDEVPCSADIKEAFWAPRRK